MTISSSLNAGIAGLASNATRLATIADNIANSTTYGYKRVEADFHSMVIGSAGGSYAAGGVRATTQRLIDQGGSLVSTSNATDLAVRGKGMIPVASATQVAATGTFSEMLLTSTGSFRPDADGYLRTESGLVLLGWPAAADGAIPTLPRETSAGLEPVRVTTALFTGEPTTSVELGVNLPATETESTGSGDSETLTVEYFDNLGKSASLGFEFVPTVPATGASNEWTMIVTDSASGNAVVGNYTLTFDDSRTAGGRLLSVADTVGGAYDPTTGSMVVTVDGGPMEINIGLIGEADGLTQLADNFAPVSIVKDGLSVGNMTSVEVDANGYVRAFFDTGASVTIYQVPIASVQNPNGLTALDYQTYKVTPDSGPFFLWDAGDGPVGEVVAFAREESTTDVAAELTSMIRTQRAYSTNAKVFQTVDEMLQETTNIKR